MSIPKHFLILAFLFAFIPSFALSQQVVLSFDEGFLGELGNNKCVTNCEYTSTLGITNLRFGQVNDTGQFTAQGNDILGFVKFFDSNGDEYQINGFINWRITTGNSPRAFGFIPDNTSTVTIQTTAGAFNIYGSSQNTGTTPTSTFGFILEGLTVTVAAGESESGNAAGSKTVGNLNAELDKQPRIIISDVTVNEGDGTATVTVSFDPGNGVDIGASPAPTEESTVEYSIQDSTAQAGSDYSTVSGTLTFPSGSTASQTFTIPITDDTIIEEDEFIIALLSNPTGDISITDNKGIVTIQDNDTEQGGDLTLTLTQRSCWRFLSSPFQNLTYNDIIGPLWTQGATGSDDPPPAADESVSNIFIWDKTTTSNAVSGWTTTGLNLNSAIPAGEGFLMSIFEDDNADGTIDVSEEFDKTLTITGTAHPFDAIISPSMNQNQDGWTLVGNPFNDAIDFGYLVANGLTTDLTDVAYVYNINGADDGLDNTNGNPGGWVSTDGSIGDLHDGKIAVFQGFFVQNSSTSTNPGITFNNASRTTGATFYGKQKEQKDYVRLELNGESVYNSAWVAFSKTGSNVRVKGDAFELIPFKDKYSLLASRKGDDILDIGQFSNDAGTEIPIYTEFAESGTYTIRATDIRLYSTKDLYFKDNENGSITPIDENFNYQFFVSKSQKNQGQIAQLSCGSSGHEFANVFSPVRAEKSNSSEDRFSIIVGSVNNEESEIPENVTLDQNYPNPFNPTTQIRYQLPQQSNVLLEVYDLTGKLITTLVNETVSAGSHTVRFNASALSSGVYMYRLQTGDNILSRKLTIIK